MHQPHSPQIDLKDSPQEVNAPSRQRFFRSRVLVGGVLIACCAIGVLGIFRHEPPVRVGLLKIFAILYAVHDPSFKQEINTGPPPSRVVSSAVAEIAIPLEKSSSGSQLTVPGRFTISCSQPASEVGQGGGASTDATVHAEFHAEDLNSSKLDAFHLAAKDILDQSTDEFELSNQIRRLTRHGIDTAAIKVSNPDEILLAARAGRPLLCNDFATLYVALASLKGYTARVLGLSSHGLTFEHAVAEIYSTSLGKWILIDPDFNIAYRRDNHWLSAAEIHDEWAKLQSQVRREIQDKANVDVDAYWASKKAQLPASMQIEAVPLGEAGEELRKSNLETGRTGLGLELYENVFYTIRNDYFSASYPFAHPTRVKQYLISNAPAEFIPRVCPEAIRLVDRRQVYFPVGRTNVSFSYPRENPETDNSQPLTFHLDTFTPNFSHFEIMQDDILDMKLTDAKFLRKLTPGKHEFNIRTVNSMGLKGESTMIKILVLGH